MEIKKLNMNKKAQWATAMQIVLWILVFAGLLYAVYIGLKKIGYI